MLAVLLLLFKKNFRFLITSTTLKKCLAEEIFFLPRNAILNDCTKIVKRKVGSSPINDFMREFFRLHS